jgi:hypothetical protein
MEIKAEILTAQQARDIVEKSELRGYGHRERIERYKEWMQEEKWSLFYNGTAAKFINDPLIFLPNGILYEGKHRIIALSELPDNIAVEFWILRNFTEVETFRRWLRDSQSNQLPVIKWLSKTLPEHPRASLKDKLP